MENEAKMLSDTVRGSTSQLTSVLVDTYQQGTQSEDKEAARETLRVAGIYTQCLVPVLHCIGSKSLFPAGRVCPVETAAKFPSQVPFSDTAVPSTADTLSPNAKGIIKFSTLVF